MDGQVEAPLADVRAREPGGDPQPLARRERPVGHERRTQQDVAGRRIPAWSPLLEPVTRTRSDGPARRETRSADPAPCVKWMPWALASRNRSFVTHPPIRDTAAGLR